jgi:hypothetical protein
MVKALKGNQIILGLSDVNLERLKDGQPIKFNLKELGLPDYEVFIFNGKDEQTMRKMFMDNKLIHPIKTVIRDDNAAKKN